MKKEKYGRIINIISTSIKAAAERSRCIKHYQRLLQSWSKTLAGELAQFGITVNNVLPGATKPKDSFSFLKTGQWHPVKTLKKLKEWMKEIPAARFAEPKKKLLMR